MKHFILLAILCFVSGCRTTLDTTSPHLIAINPDGKLYRHPDSEDYTGSQHFSNILRNIEIQRTNENRITNILFFVQGGLNDLKHGVDRAETLSSAILTNDHRPAYPIFIAWDASFTATYADHLYRIRRGRADRYGKYTAPFYLLGDLGRMIFRAPVSLSLQTQSDLKAVFMLKTPYSTNASQEGWYWINPSIEEANKAAEVVLQRRPELHLFLGDDQEDFSIKARNGFAYFLTLPFKVLLTPVIDTAGKNAWDKMYRRTDTMFTTPHSFNHAALYHFLSQLARYCQDHPEMRVTLVGHSMGTIVCNEIVRQDFGLPISAIVYMAAACGIDDWANSVVPHLKENPGVNFYNLMLHPLNDARETHYGMFWDAPPRGSLLEWIDNYYSASETDFGRTLGKWENSIMVLSGDVIPSEIDQQLNFRAFEMGNKKTSGPQKHGDVDDYPFWDPAFWKTPDESPRAFEAQRQLPPALAK